MRKHCSMHYASLTCSLCVTSLCWALKYTSSDVITCTILLNQKITACMLVLATIFGTLEHSHNLSCIHPLHTDVFAQNDLPKSFSSLASWQCAGSPPLHSDDVSRDKQSAAKPYEPLYIKYSMSRIACSCCSRLPLLKCEYSESVNALYFLRVGSRSIVRSELRALGMMRDEIWSICSSVSSLAVGLQPGDDNYKRDSATYIT